MEGSWNEANVFCFETWTSALLLVSPSTTTEILILTSTQKQHMSSRSGIMQSGKSSIMYLMIRVNWEDNQNMFAQLAN